MSDTDCPSPRSILSVSLFPQLCYILNTSFGGSATTSQCKEMYLYSPAYSFSLVFGARTKIPSCTNSSYRDSMVLKNVKLLLIQDDPLGSRYNTQKRNNNNKCFVMLIKPFKARVNALLCIGNHMRPSTIKD